MLNDIMSELGENFRTGDETILEKFIDEVTTDALSISNRQETDKNIEILSSEIKECVKGKYLLRGAEGSKSISDDGRSINIGDPMEKLRIDIVKNGKRVPFV